MRTEPTLTRKRSVRNRAFRENSFTAIGKHALSGSSADIPEINVKQRLECAVVGGLLTGFGIGSPPGTRVARNVTVLPGEWGQCGASHYSGWFSFGVPKSQIRRVWRHMEAVRSGPRHPSGHTVVLFSRWGVRGCNIEPFGAHVTTHIPPFRDG